MAIPDIPGRGAKKPHVFGVFKDFGNREAGRHKPIISVKKFIAFLLVTIVLFPASFAADNNKQLNKPKNKQSKAMSRVFRVVPKRIKRSNGTVLTPEMVVTVTMSIPTSNPFTNGAKEIKEAYMRLYKFDYQKACCNQNDFDFFKLD